MDRLTRPLYVKSLESLPHVFTWTRDLWTYSIALKQPVVLTVNADHDSLADRRSNCIRSNAQISTHFGAGDFNELEHLPVVLRNWNKKWELAYQIRSNIFREAIVYDVAILFPGRRGIATMWVSVHGTIAVRVTDRVSGKRKCWGERPFCLTWAIFFRKFNPLEPLCSLCFKPSIACHS